jgi:hypothetical protein
MVAPCAGPGSQPVARKADRDDADHDDADHDGVGPRLVLRRRRGIPG